MRRMIPNPRKIIKCSFENSDNLSIIYVPIKNVNELPITFDLIISNTAIGIAHIYAYFSPGNFEVYGGCGFVIIGDEKGNINASIEPDSLLRPEYPYLTLNLNYQRGDIQSAPIPDGAQVFVTNVIHLEKGVIDIN